MWVKSLINERDYPFTSSRLYIVISLLVGVFIGFICKPSSGFFDTIIAGLFFGVFVVLGAIGSLLDSVINFEKHRYNLIGWVTVFFMYGSWLFYKYELDPYIPIGEGLFYRFLALGSATWFIGWFLLGTLFKSKFEKVKQE